MKEINDPVAHSVMRAGISEALVYLTKFQTKKGKREYPSIMARKLQMLTFWQLCRKRNELDNWLIL